jgi:aspartate oxidase
MQCKDVLIIGSGIAGCLMALALAKRGISVAILTEQTEEEFNQSSFFIDLERVKESVLKFSANEETDESAPPLAFEHLNALAARSLEEFFSTAFDLPNEANLFNHLKIQLDCYSDVEWIFNASLVELLTLEQHSQKNADLFKKPTCVGAIVYHHPTGRLESYFAKETILATGGAAGFYSQTVNRKLGQAFAIAKRAGVRILELDQIHIKDDSIDESFTIGGIVIDKSAQTNLQRLRAIGECSYSGLHFLKKNDQLLGLFVWSLSCADDIAKQLSRLVYYFPEIKQSVSFFQNDSISQSDWRVLKEIFNNYLIIQNDKTHLNRAYLLLDHLHGDVLKLSSTGLSFEQLDFLNAIEVGQMIIQSALKKESLALVNG